MLHIYSESQLCYPAVVTAGAAHTFCLFGTAGSRPVDP